MPGDHSSQRSTALPVRAKALVITAGAVAAAALAMVNLWDRFFPADDMDIATIERVDVLDAPTTLVEFDASVIGGDLPLFAVRDSGAARAAIVSTVGPVVPPAKRPVATPTASSTPSPVSSQVSVERQQAPTAEYLKSLSGEEVLDDVPPVVVEKMTRIVNEGRSSDPPQALPGETIVSTEEIATGLAGLLDHVDSVVIDGKKYPRGWIVTVDLRLDGLAHEPLLLTWTLAGESVPTEWSSPNVAYRVTATTPHDAGSARFWVPDMRAPGPFTVTVALSFESDGNVARIAPPEAVAND